MDDFHPATAPPPPDLADRFIKTVIAIHPEWEAFLSPVEDYYGPARFFVIPGEVQTVEVVFNVKQPGDIFVSWPGAHLHYGFDWHVEPTVETVTREVVCEVERRLRGEGDPPMIIPIDPSRYPERDETD